MLEQNKSLQKITVTVIKDREFKPNEGIGVFSLSMREKDLIKILKSEDVQYIIDKTDDNVVLYDYRDQKSYVMFYFHYNKRGWDYLSIHTNSLTLDGVEIYNKPFNEVFLIVQNFLHKRNILFEFEFKPLGDEDFVDFKNIGLSIWLENDLVSDIAITR